MVGHSAPLAGRTGASALTDGLSRRRLAQAALAGAIALGFAGSAVAASSGSVEVELTRPVAILQPGIVYIPPVGDRREVDVYFDWDKSELKARGLEQVRAFADRLKAWGGGVDMTVIGHADRSGPDAYNMALSQRRAVAVRDRLVAEGVSPAVIRVRWRGEREPAVPTADGVRQPENRRSFIRLDLNAAHQSAAARAGWAQFQAGDYDAAIASWQPLAERGQRAAMTYMGYFHENGLGVPVDAAKAADYYRQAADAGDAMAGNRLGVMLAGGRGVAKDEAAAVTRFRQAADAGLAVAHLNLGTMQEHGLGAPADRDAAIASYLAAVQGGELRAATNLGTLALDAPQQTLDGRTAADWFRLAALQGDAVAQNNLGVLHATGNGVRRDRVEALAWFELAAVVMPVEAYADDMWTDAVARSSLTRFYKTARGNRDALRDIASARQRRAAQDLAGSWTRSMAVAN